MQKSVTIMVKKGKMLERILKKTLLERKSL